MSSSWFASLGLLLMASRSTVAAERPDRMDFGQMDQDGNGFIDRAEYLLGAKGALMDEPASADSRIRASVYEFVGNLFDTVDVDGDGMLNAREVEFAEYLAALETTTVRAAVEARRAQGSEEPLHEDEFGFSSKHMEDLMDELDLNNDRTLSLTEWGQAWRLTLQDWGWQAKRLDNPALEKVMDRMFVKADILADNMLDLRELQFAAFLLTDFAVQQIVAAMYRDFDADRDGKIFEAELEAQALDRRANRRRGEGPTLTERLVQAFSDLDSDSSGYLSRREVESVAAMVLKGDFSV